jgi:hypothetical protein
VRAVFLACLVAVAAAPPAAHAYVAPGATIVSASLERLEQADDATLSVAFSTAEPLDAANLNGANPSPETLQYVTVYDNGDKGGFAGSKPVSQPETFRCGFEKRQGQLPEE